MIIRLLVDIQANDSDKDAVLRAFQEPDMSDSIEEALERYLGVTYVLAHVLEVK